MKTEIDKLMEVMEAAFDPCWREAWTRRQVEDSLLMPHTFAVVIDALGAPVTGDAQAAGFFLARRAPGEVELLLIAVHPDFRGNGLGRELLELFEQRATDDDAERIFLEMRDGNPAEHLYRKFGFVPIGRRNGYYRTTSGAMIDAITYGKSLSAGTTA